MRLRGAFVMRGGHVHSEPIDVHAGGTPATQEAPVRSSSPEPLPLSPSHRPLVSDRGSGLGADATATAVGAGPLLQSPSRGVPLVHLAIFEFLLPFSFPSRSPFPRLRTPPQSHHPLPTLRPSPTTLSRMPRNPSRSSPPSRPRPSALPRVALLIETSRQYGRDLLRGVIRYQREHGPWSMYFEPHGLGEPPPR